MQNATHCTSDTNTQHLHDETKVLPMDTHLKLYATQLKQLTQTQTHPLHDLNAYLNPHKNIKATIFHNNEHTNTVISEPNITPKNVKKISNTCTTITSQYTLTSPHNNSILEKTTKLLTPHLMTFIHQNKHYHVTCIQNLAQLRAKCSKPKTYTSQCPLCLSQKHDTNHLFNCSQVPTQHNTTSLWKKPLEAAEVIQVLESKLASLKG